MRVKIALNYIIGATTGGNSDTVQPSAPVSSVNSDPRKTRQRRFRNQFMMEIVLLSFI